MGKYKISVVMPVYNGETYLRQALESLCAQTLKEMEMVCVDDGSIDRTAQILQEYAATDQRIRILHQEHQGAGVARNFGIRMAVGEYLAILDSDDFFEPEFLETAYGKAVESKAQVVVVGSDQYWEKDNRFQSVDWTIRKSALPPYRPMNHRTFTDNVFKVFVGWPWDKLFERRFVEQHQLVFQNLRTSNDLVFVFMAIALAERIEVAERILIHQRRGHGGSLSNTREQSWQCFYEALRELRRQLELRGLYKELEQDYINYALHFSLWNLRTLKGEKKKDLFRALKKSWFHELGITAYPEEYFFDKKEYAEYRKIKKTTWGNYEKYESGKH